MHGIIQLSGRDLTDLGTLAANRVKMVVRQAVRRRFAVVAIEQLAFALAPVLGGLVILLLAGTQILHWYWLALLAVAGIIIAAIRIRARSLSHYQTAQLLDKRLRLDDSLSTAWFLLEKGGSRRNGLAALQLRQAEDVAAGTEPALAFPLVWNRAWALTGALVAIAFGLFVVRYLVTRSLSLEQSLIPVQIAPVFERLENHLFAANRLPGDASASGRAQQNAAQAAQLPDQKTVDVSQSEGEEAGQSTDPNGKAGSRSQAATDKNGKQQDGDNQNRDVDSANAQAGGKTSDQPAGNQTSAQKGEPKPQASGGQQGGQSAMDKMKDALSSSNGQNAPEFNPASAAGRTAVRRR